MKFLAFQSQEIPQLSQVCNLCGESPSYKLESVIVLTYGYRFSFLRIDFKLNKGKETISILCRKVSVEFAQSARSAFVDVLQAVIEIQRRS